MNASNQVDSGVFIQPIACLVYRQSEPHNLKNQHLGGFGHGINSNKPMARSVDAPSVIESESFLA